MPIGRWGGQRITAKAARRPANSSGATPLAAYNKLNGFVEHLAEKVHNLQSDALTLALSNTAPGSEGTPPTGSTAACILGNVTQVAYTNLSSRLLTVTSSAQSAGTYSNVCSDLVLTSSGGSTGPFRYIYVYNDTPTSPADPLLGYYDYGSSISLNSGETFTFDLGTELLTIA